MGRTARRERREAPEGGGARGHRTHGVGRRRAEQVPRQDCLGLEEAGWPHRRLRPSAWRCSSSGLPVDALWGVGPRTAERLRAAGLTRLIDVRAADPRGFARWSGAWRTGCSRSHRGSTTGSSSPIARPSRAARSERSRKTSSISTRFARKRRGWPSEPRSWLEKRGLFARTVTLKVRYHDFPTITRSHSEKPATRDIARIIARAVALLDRTDAGTRPVRLLGVSVHGLCEEPGEEPVRVRRPGATLPFEEPG